MDTPELLSDSEISAFLDSLRSSAARHAEALWRIEEPLELEAGFVQALLEEVNDWAFVIKTSVVLESALGQVLSESLLGAALERHIRALPMDGRTGKIQLAGDIGLIGPKSVARFRALCAIRNDFAHGLKALQLSIPEYFKRMANDEFEALVLKLFSSDRGIPAQPALERKRKMDRPSLQSKRDGRVGKYLLWTGACVSLLELSEAHRRTVADKNERDAFTLLGHAFVARQHGEEGAARRHMRAALVIFESMDGRSKHPEVRTLSNEDT